MYWKWKLAKRPYYSYPRDKVSATENFLWLNFFCKQIFRVFVCDKSKLQEIFSGGHFAKGDTNRKHCS